MSVNTNNKKDRHYLLSIFGFILFCFQVYDYTINGCVRGVGSMPKVCGEGVAPIFLLCILLSAFFPARLIYLILKDHLANPPAPKQ